MQARKIDLEPYPVTFAPKLPDGEYPTYDVRTSLVNLCFIPELQLNGAALMLHQKIAQQILDAGDYVLLAAGDWGRLAETVDKHTGFGRADVEFVRRVKEAALVDVQETQQKDEAMDNDPTST